jgi:aspartate aminotransferase
VKRALDRVLEALNAHSDPDRSWLVGSPWFEPPDELRRAMREAASASSFDYPPPQGIGELRAAVAELHRRDGLALAPENVLITHGAKSGLLAVFGCVLQPGDEILHPVPCYPAYPAAVMALGGIPVPVPHEDGRSLFEPAAIEARITPRTRALVLSSPANPTGATLTGDQARELVELCREHGLRLVCDEAYEAFRFAPDTDRLPAHWDPNLETVIQVRSFSKTYALCGWRIGYVAADAALIRRLTSWQSALLNPPNSIAQQALISAPAVPPSFSQEVGRRVRNRLDELVAVLTDTGIEVEPPQGGFYVWADLRSRLAATGHTDTSAWCADFAGQHGIGLWPGDDFLAPGWVRASAVACADSDWESALDRLGRELRSFMNERKSR